MNEFTFSLVLQAVRVFVSPTTFVHLIVHRHRAFHWQSVANSRTKCGSRARMAVKQPAIMEGQFVPKYWKYYNLIHFKSDPFKLSGVCDWRRLRMRHIQGIHSRISRRSMYKDEWVPTIERLWLLTSWQEDRPIKLMSLGEQFSQ